MTMRSTSVVNLSCAYCGRSVMVEIDEGRATIECDETSCGAVWNSFGEVVRTPEMFREASAAIGRRWHDLAAKRDAAKRASE